MMAGRDRARGRVPPAQPRARPRPGQRASDQLRPRHARLGPGRDVRARARGAVSTRADRVRRAARSDRQLPDVVARMRAPLPGPLGRGRTPGGHRDQLRLPDQRDHGPDRARAAACSSRRPRYLGRTRRGARARAARRAPAAPRPRARRPCGGRVAGRGRASGRSRKLAPSIRSRSRSGTSGSRASSRTGSGRRARSTRRRSGSRSRTGSSSTATRAAARTPGARAAARTRRRGRSPSRATRANGSRRSPSSTGSGPARRRSSCGGSWAGGARARRRARIRPD